MSLADDIRAMVAEKEEPYRKRMEQQQVDAEEQSRSSAEFKEQFATLFRGVVLPRLYEVQYGFRDSEHIKADVSEDRNRAILTLSSLLNGSQSTITVYGADTGTVRGMGIRTDSGNVPNAPVKDEEPLQLSEVTPEWISSYLKDFTKQVLDSERLIPNVTDSP